MKAHLRYFSVSLISIVIVFFLTAIKSISFTDPTAAMIYSALYNLVIFLVTLAMLGGWGISVVKRIMQPRVRKYLIFIDAAMILWLVVRELKWRYVTSQHAESILWYLYYIPMILIPTYSFFSALHLGKNEESRLNYKWHAVYITSFALIMMVLTNNIHGFVFKLNFPYAVNSGDYTYGPGYYIVAAWIVIFTVLFIVIAGRKCNQETIGRRKYIPLLYLLLGLVYALGYVHKDELRFFPDVDLMLAFDWFTIMIWETCIELGLIVVNSYYLDFFKNSSIGAQITDWEGNPYISASTAINLPKEAFDELKEKGTYQYNLGVRLHIYPSSCGYTIWQEDVSKVNGMISELRDLQEELKEGNTLAEQEMRAEIRRKQTEEQTRLYTLLSQSMEDELALINGLSRRLLQSTDETEMRKFLATINFVGVYLKRKCNFIMIAETNTTIPWEELELALMEIEKNVLLCNLQFSYKLNLDRELERHEVIGAFEAIETLIEACLFKTNAMYIQLDSNSQGLKLLSKQPGVKDANFEFERRVYNV